MFSPQEEQVLQWIITGDHVSISQLPERWFTVCPPDVSKIYWEYATRDPKILQVLISGFDQVPYSVLQNITSMGDFDLYRIIRGTPCEKRITWRCHCDEHASMSPKHLADIIMRLCYYIHENSNWGKYLYDRFQDSTPLERGELLLLLVDYDRVTDVEFILWNFNPVITPLLLVNAEERGEPRMIDILKSQIMGHSL